MFSLIPEEKPQDAFCNLSHGANYVKAINPVFQRLKLPVAKLAHMFKGGLHVFLY